MKKLTKAWSLSLAVLLCCGELLQAAPKPSEMPSNPVYYKRLHRNRPYQYRDMDVYEVRELYYVQHTTPKPKVRPLTDVEVDQLIRCDFEPMLPECAKLIPTTSNNKLIPTEATSTIPTTSTIGTTSTTGTTSTIGTTSTDLPLLPVLPQDSSDFHEVTVTTTTSPEDEDYLMESDEGTEEFGEVEGENVDDDNSEAVEAEGIFGGSIGGNDLTK
ncbi:hypothetical protein ACLKA7_001400 [Drosophila subpalustris]